MYHAEYGPTFHRPRLAAAVCAILVLAGCREGRMVDQAYLEPLEAPVLFADVSRPPEGVVPFGTFREDAALYTGVRDGELLATIPMEVNAGLLERGRERFDIFCSPCHDRAGTGNGMVIRRGFRSRPPSFHIGRLRTAPAGHFFDVMTYGFGAMQDYAVQVRPEDRWAIVAYIRALQLSQAAPLEIVPTESLEELEATQ